MDEFSTILRETEAAIRLCIAARGIPLAEVDEVAQDVFIEFYKAQDRRPAEVEPIRWLKGMARIHCLRWFQRNGRRGRLLVALNEASAPVTSPFEEVEDPDDLLETLRRCMSKLPDHSQGLLSGFYGEDESVDRASSGVRMAVMRLRDILRECMHRARGADA